MAELFDVAIIGAGPAGTVAAALLNKQGFNVCILEKQHFPRFVIGESLLPAAMDILAEAGLSAAIEAAGFQQKNGIAFTWQRHYASFDFGQQYGSGRTSAIQVEREHFDKILADETIRQGVQTRFGENVVNIDNGGELAVLYVQPQHGRKYGIRARFILDASGYFRTVPRLLNWEITRGYVQRNVYCTHITDHITYPAYDRKKTLIAVHPKHRDIWFWLIPFANGRSSIGLVGDEHYFKHLTNGASEILKTLALQVPMFAAILDKAEWKNDKPFLYFPSYSAGVRKMFGPKFALLGTAAGFADPVFSSGMLTAIHSAKLAAAATARQLRGENVNWQHEYADRQTFGANTFGNLIKHWYDGTLQNWLFDTQHSLDKQKLEKRKMLCAILAGYAWDESNPIVHKIHAGHF